MGATLTVQHLAVVPPSFFNVLAQRATRLLHFTAASVKGQMRGLETRDLALMQSDDEALARQINVRHFVREQGPVERRLPVASIESFNSIPEQGLFAIAAIKAGVAGRQVRRSLELHFAGKADKLEPQQRLALAEKLGEFASLPKTRVRMPGGTQHLLADDLPSLLQQTEALNRALLQVGLCAYAPRGANLSLPNTPGVQIDRDDALARGGMVPTLVRRDLIDGQAEVSVSLSFGHVLAASRQRGLSILADLASSCLLPKTDLRTRSGAHYLVSNSPGAMESALSQGTDKNNVFVISAPQRALM